ncbi:MAG TPA: hypothetical protein VG916_15630 [Gemmatimonadaceae bacterium]|nr:hypothetical protein [Gemmatimonadaceae bacterium]
MPVTDGFFVTGGATWDTFRGDSLTRGQTESAPYFAVGIGFAPIPQIAALMSGGGAHFRQGQASRYEVGELDLGLRAHFAREDARLVPYAEYAFTWTIVRRDTAATNRDPEAGTYERRPDISGNGNAVGGGLLFYLRPNWALDAGTRWTWARLMALKPGSVGRPDLALNATAFRVFLGVTMYGGKETLPSR